MSSNGQQRAMSDLIVEAAGADTEAVGRANPMANGNGHAEDAEQETNAVVEHLLFHRALADHDPDRLTEYLSMARSDVASFRNRFDRAIALTFHLVLDEHMDPWSIDLAKFSSLYAKRIRDTPAVDLITGGRLLALAWGVLLRQTEGLLERAQPKEEEPEEEMWDLGWDEMPAFWGEPDPDEQYTERVLDEENDPPISESVFHQGDRRVTLYELVEALEEGRREAERRKRLAAERERFKQEQADEEDEDVREKVHKEDLEAEIDSVRTRFKALEQETALRQVYDGSRDDYLTLFISSLFLSRAEMIDLRQEDFPYTPIFVTPCEPLFDDDTPLVGIPKTGPDAEADEDGDPDVNDSPQPEPTVAEQ